MSIEPHPKIRNVDVVGIDPITVFCKGSRLLFTQT